VGKGVSTVIIDRSTLFRSGLEHLLRGSGYRIIASLAEAGELQRIKVPTGSALFIMNVEDVWRDSGHALKEIRALCPEARIVMMGASFATQQIHLVMRAGADACLLTTITFNEFVQSLDVILLGKSVLSAGLRLFDDQAEPAATKRLQIEQRFETSRDTEQQPPRRIPDQLSPRERQILACLVQGESNKVIALRYCLTESTVKAHMKAVLRKIGAANRTQAAIWARDNDPAGRQPEPLH
jgi:two-component system nitrate/nitrite response regulator NarL